MKKAAKIGLTFFGIYQVKNGGLSRYLPKIFTILVDFIADFFIGLSLPSNKVSFKMNGFDLAIYEVILN